MWWLYFYTFPYLLKLEDTHTHTGNNTLQTYPIKTIEKRFEVFALNCIYLYIILTKFKCHF